MSKTDLLETPGVPSRAAAPSKDLMEPTGPGRVVRLHDGRRAWWRPEDASWGSSLAARALLNLGVGQADRVLVALEDELHREAFLSGIESIGAQAAPESAEMPEEWATVVVTEPFRALATYGVPRARVILAHGPELGTAAYQWYRERLWHDTVVSELWLVPELPGPIAVPCARGQFHITDDGMSAVFSDDAPVTQVVVTRVGMAGFQTGRTLSRDWVAPVACDCGTPGPAFAVVVDRGAPLISGGRRLLRRDVIDVLFRVPGFSGFATVDLRYDRGRGRDLLEVRVGALPGWDARRLGEATEYALSLHFGIPVRAVGLEAAAGVGVSVEERRGVVST